MDTLKPLPNNHCVWLYTCVGLPTCINKSCVSYLYCELAALSRTVTIAVYSSFHCTELFSETVAIQPHMAEIKSLSYFTDKGNMVE